MKVQIVLFEDRILFLEDAWLFDLGKDYLFLSENQSKRNKTLQFLAPNHKSTSFQDQKYDKVQFYLMSKYINSKTIL